MVTVRLLATTKDKKKTSQDIDRPKISRFRGTLLYLTSEYRNLRHTIPLTISLATTVSTFFKEFS